MNELSIGELEGLSIDELKIMECLLWDYRKKVKAVLSVKELKEEAL